MTSTHRILFEWFGYGSILSIIFTLWLGLGIFLGWFINVDSYKAYVFIAMSLIGCIVILFGYAYESINREVE